MLTDDEIMIEIYAALSRENELREPSDQIPLRPKTPLFGEGGMLKSFDLVSLILDIEDMISARTGCRITLSDERAMAAHRNPFRDPASLGNYVAALLKDASG
jgi:hypothetical protein